MIYSDRFVVTRELGTEIQSHPRFMDQKQKFEQYIKDEIGRRLGAYILSKIEPTQKDVGWGIEYSVEVLFFMTENWNKFIEDLETKAPSSFIKEAINKHLVLR